MFMGMFDTVHINTKMLPVSEKEQQALASCWLQTKDFDCTMTEVYITDEGELKINRAGYDWDDTQINAFGTYGVLIRQPEKIETIPHHGFVNFYTDGPSEWYEFFAKFTDGKLVEIIRSQE